MSMEAINTRIADFVNRRNAEFLFAASQPITSSSPKTDTKEYFTNTRKIPLTTFQISEIRSISGKVRTIRYDEKNGKISESSPKYNGAITPVYDTKGELVGVQYLELVGAQKKPYPGKPNECKKYIGAQPIGKAAVIQASLDTTKVFIAEGVETAATIAGLSGILGKYPVLASLGSDEFPKAVNYIKANFPPGCTVVLLKDHDAPGSSANNSFDKAYELFVEAGFNVVVKQPKNLDEDWNDVLVNSSKEVLNSESREGAHTEKTNPQNALEKAFKYAQTYPGTSSADVIGGNSNEDVTKVFQQIQKEINPAENAAIQNRELNAAVEPIKQLAARIKKQFPADQPAPTSIDDIVSMVRTMNQYRVDIAKIHFYLEQVCGVAMPNSSNNAIQEFEELNQQYLQKKKEQEEEIKALTDDYDSQLLLFNQYYRSLDGSPLKERISKSIEHLTSLEPDKNGFIAAIIVSLKALEKKDEDALALLNNIRGSVVLDAESIKDRLIRGIREKYKPQLEERITACGNKFAESVKGSLSQLETYLQEIEKQQKKFDADRQVSRGITAAEGTYLSAMTYTDSILPGQDAKQQLQAWLNSALRFYTTSKSLKEPAWPLTQHTFTSENVRLVVGDVDEEKLLSNLCIEILSRSGIAELIKPDPTPEEEILREQLLVYAIELATQLCKSFDVAIPWDNQQTQEFDGVYMLDGKPTLIERKTNEGTGPHQLQTHFATEKILSKFEFLNRSSELTSEKNFPFDIRLEKPNVPFDTSDPRFEGIMNAAKSIAIDALNERRLELVVNNPRNPGTRDSVTAVAYPPAAFSSLRVRVSNEGKGEEKVFNAQADNAREKLQSRARGSSTRYTFFDHLSDRQNGFPAPDQTSNQNNIGLDADTVEPRTPTKSIRN